MANILSITDSTKKEEKRKKSAEPGEQFFCEKKKTRKKIGVLGKKFLLMYTDACKFCRQDTYKI
jgi:hypothetical protein